MTTAEINPDRIDPEHSIRDTRMVRKALRQGWKIPEHYRDILPEAIAEIATNTNKGDGHRIAAAKVLVEMDRANIAAERESAPREQHNQQINVYMPSNSREAVDQTPDAQHITASVNGAIEQASNATELSLALPDAGDRGLPLNCEIVQVTPAPVAQAR